MKKLIVIYRIVCIILIVFLCFMYTQYNNKKTQEIVNITNPNFVFLGDSITELYDLKKYYGDTLPLVNSGMGGHKTTEILNDMGNRIYRYNPSKVILLIGINNYLTHEKIYTVEDVVGDIDSIVSQIQNRLPNCEIYVESIYPMNDDWDGFIPTEKIEETNKGIRDVCNKYNIKYIDVFSKLLDKDTNQLNKKYSDEGLHMNEEGYKIITEIVKKSVF